MWWRVRTTLPDRPGALARLTRSCGAAGVNILGLQIFPGIDRVTDELVLRTPVAWGVDEVAGLVRAAGGGDVVVSRCSEAALTDQPTRYVQAARAVLARPMSFPEVVARLFDADVQPMAVRGVPEAMPDVMELVVADVVVQIRRATAFTATEHARGAALAGLVSDVLQRTREPSMLSGVAGVDEGRRTASGTGPDLVVTGDSVSALIDDVVVGLATLHEPLADEPDARPVTLRVDPSYRRRGIGTRLLVEAARLACAEGASEVLLRARAENEAVLPMVLGAGLRGRIRMAGDTLTVRIPVREMRPLPS